MRARQTRNDLESIVEHWKHISHDIHDPRNAADYDKLSTLLDDLLDIVGEDETHELMGLIDVISHMLTTYDKRHNDQLKEASGIDALKFLMEQHHLNQSELPEIGSQGVVSEVLQGKRKLNINQIKKLSQKFHVSPNTFID